MKLEFSLDLICDEFKLRSPLINKICDYALQSAIFEYFLTKTFRNCVIQQFFFI